MKTTISFLVFLLFISGSSLAVNCNSLGTANWNIPSTWSCGSVPIGGDEILISLGDTVAISTVINIMGLAVTVHVQGVLIFDSPNSQLNLPCNSVIVITPTGSIQTSGPSQANQVIRICRGDVWQGADGTLTGPTIIGLILPLELTYFDAESTNNGIDFTWQTASEENNDYFTIEGSFDGENWLVMNQIEGAGSTQEVQNYSFTSSNVEQFEYFRLKQTDFDGMFSYSDIVAVPLVITELTIYPNPNNGSELTIEFESKDSGLLQLLRYDGRVAHSQDISGLKGLTLNDLDLASGAYIVQVQRKNSLYTKRLMIQR
ncbi:MAG: T9SS type A sorting domain-containing protein [Crocinitomicaceae bacterium]